MFQYVCKMKSFFYVLEFGQILLEFLLKLMSPSRISIFLVLICTIGSTDLI